MYWCECISGLQKHNLWTLWSGGICARWYNGKLHNSFSLLLVFLYFVHHEVSVSGSAKQPHAYFVTVVQAHKVIIRPMTPCRWMPHHAAIWQTSGRRLWCESTIWLFPAINLMQERLSELCYQMLLLCQLLSKFSAHPIPQVKCLYELVFSMTTLVQYSSLYMFLCSGLHQTDVDSLLPALQFSCCVLFNICFSVSVPELLLATFAKDNCPIMPHWEHFWGVAALQFWQWLLSLFGTGLSAPWCFASRPWRADFLLKHYLIHEYL